MGTEILITAITIIGFLALRMAARHLMRMSSRK